MNTIEQDLVALGETADEVAGTLLSLGACGNVGEPRSCPVFIYLNHKGHTQVKEVDDRSISTYDNNDYATPEPVAAFILAFDEGKYPSLDIMRDEEE